jgi:hypothetical protein
MNLKIEKETTLKVRGQNVVFREFEYSAEGDFVKVCTDDHDILIIRTVNGRLKTLYFDISQLMADLARIVRAGQT